MRNTASNQAVWNRQSLFAARQNGRHIEGFLFISVMLYFMFLLRIARNLFFFLPGRIILSIPTQGLQTLRRGQLAPQPGRVHGHWVWAWEEQSSLAATCVQDSTSTQGRTQGMWKKSWPLDSLESLTSSWVASRVGPVPTEFLNSGAFLTGKQS